MIRRLLAALLLMSAGLALTGCGEGDDVKTVFFVRVERGNAIGDIARIDLKVEGRQTFVVPLENKDGAALGLPLTRQVALPDDQAGQVVVTATAIGTGGETLGTAITPGEIVPGETITLVLEFGVDKSMLDGGVPESDAGGDAGTGTEVDAGTPAMLTLSPALRDLGSAVVATSTPPSSFTVGNDGQQPSGPLTLHLTGSGASAFAVSPGSSCQGATLGEGASCTIAVVFTPTAAGAVTAMLEVGGLPGGTVTAALSATGLTPGDLGISPTMQSFGSIVTGQSSANHVFTIANNGGASTGAPTVRLDGTDRAQFSIVTNTCTSALAAAATCTISVRMTPSATGPISATLLVTGMPGGSVTTQLSGTGLAPPALTITPVARDLGTIVTGQRASGSFTVMNSGGAPSSNLTTVLGGPAAADYLLLSNGCAGSPLLAGASCQLTVQLTAATPGMRAATLTVSASAGGSLTANLSATVVSQGALRLTPTMQPFGAIVVGRDSAPQSFTLTNIGGSTTSVPSATITGSAAADFRLSSSTCTAALPANATCSITVVMRPSVAGDSTAQLTVSAATGGTASATLTGTGLTQAELVITPATDHFGSIVTGQSSPTHDFTIANRGGSPSGAVTATLGGTDATQFAITANSCTTLAAGATCAVTLRMSPISVGARSASLVVSASPGGSVTAQLSGVGLAPPALTIAPPSQDLGTVVAGQRASASFTIRNPGGAQTGALTTSLGGAAAADYALLSNGCAGAPLAAGDSCQVTVQLTAASLGARTATLTITGSPGGTLTANVMASVVSQGELRLTPTTQLFGAVEPGLDSAAQSFTLSNPGGSSTTLPMATLTGTAAADFRITSNSCTAALPAGGTCSLSVIMHPSVPGGRAAQLNISAATGGAASASLSGTGLTAAELRLAPLQWNFGSIVSGQSSLTQSFTISNAGGSPSGVVTGGLGGTDSGQFAITASSCGRVLLAADSCTVTVRMNPTSAGAKSASLTVAGTPGGSLSAPLSGLGLVPPSLSMTPASSNLGTVVTGQTAGVRFTVSNPGGAPTSNLTTAIAGPAAADYVLVSNGCAATALAGGDSCQVTVQLAAGTLGTRTATLTVAAATGGSQTASITASVVSQGALRLSPGSQLFGDVVLGQDSAAQSFMLSNIGGSATTVPTATLTGAAAADFRISDNTCTAALAAGATCSISVVMRPSSAGARAAQLDVSASTGGTVTASLAGNGLTPARLDISPSTHDFGSVVLSASSAAQPFTIINSGGAPSSILSATMAGTVPADFRISANTCTTTLAAGASCSLSVTMSPGAAGTRVARLDVSASTGGTASAALSGTGLTPARLTIAPVSRDFGSIVMSQPSAAQPFLVSNTGGAASTIPTLRLTGTNPGDFTITASTCTAALAGGGTCSISVTMTPSAAGGRAATLEVNATTGGLATVALTGTGLTPARLTVAPATRDFGSIVTGLTSAAQGFTISNAGGAPSTIPAASLTGTNPGDFAISANTCTASLAAGATCSISITMTPTATGARAATLNLAASTGGSATATVTGTGLAPARLIASPALNDFGTIDVGQQSSDLTWTISNVGAVQATGLALSQSGDATQFSVVNSCTATLASGTSCDVTVRFVPTSAGALNAKLTMTATVGGSVTLNVIGTGRGAQLLTVATAGTGTGGVNAVAPAGGIACPTDCTEGYPFNTPVTLVATAVPGSAFTGWSDPNCRGTGACIVTMSGPQTITATFTLLPRFRLTVDRTLGSATGTVASTSDTPPGISCGTDCIEDYISGTSVTLRATPAASPANVIFTGWSGACLAAGTSPTCTVTMSAIRNVGASFAVRQFPLAILNNNSGTMAGSVNYGGNNCSAGSQCSASFDQNTMVTIQPVPRSGTGAGPDYWWADPTVSPNDPCRNTLHNRPCVVTMSQARTVAVFFGFIVN